MTVAAKLHFLDDAERSRLRSLVNQSDLARAARALGVSRGVVSSAVAGIGVRKGSLEQLRDALAKKLKIEETK